MGEGLALCSSLCWGGSDFLGGRATRTWGALRVLFWSQTSTLVLLWFAVGTAAWAGAVPVSARAIAIGAAGGCAGVIGLAAFYQALAIGPMAVVPPIAAAGVVVPVAVGLATGDPPTTAALAGLGIAVMGVVLASTSRGREAVDGTSAPRMSARVLALCLIAAGAFAIVFLALDAGAADQPRTVLVVTAGVRLGSCVMLLLAALVTRSDPRRDLAPRDLRGFAGIGLLDTAANLLFALAAATGALEVVSVLGSLYPAVTSGLAHVVLGERLSRLQLLGVVLALTGSALLAAR